MIRTGAFNWTQPLISSLIPNSKRKLVACYSVIILGIGFFHPSDLKAGPLDEWRVADSASTTNSLGHVIYANGMFVTVGTHGTILTSGDGITWANQISGTDGDLSRIAFGGNHFVALGSIGGKGLMLNSSDAVHWTTNPLQNFKGVTGISYANGQFIFISIDGSTQRSPNGIDWIMQRAPLPFTAPPPLLALTPVSGGFLMMTAGSELFTSTDGTIWADFSNVGPFMYLQLSGIIQEKNQFVAVGPFGVITTSPDGTNWTRRARQFEGNISKIASGNGFFVAIGNATTGGNPTPVIASADGITWTGHNPASVTQLNGVAFGNNRFIVTGRSGAILYSGVISDDQAILGPVSVRSDGVAQVTFRGRAGLTYSVQSSSDLAQWVNETNVMLTAQSHLFLDANSKKLPQRFYRVIVP
jgi:hypothetical protein